ncbi:hypothetical protein J2046_001422 [Rhizobium petrolearium]|uniref:STAS domain-containing protein n=1 Tax=Neorhizobium petrolearium TaxID=515361 RepID=UPI001AE9090E|nr:STAS domain-containing protein [Neorhizobium petrolearium]MBP1843168.1 hypothetical protein [Neorhizobium petrolearium]
MSTPDFKEDPFQLPQNLTVRTISAVRQEILQLIDKNKSTTIEITDDCQVDISFIQLMEAARIYAGSAGKHIALTRPASGPVLDILKRGGVLEGMSDDDAKFWLHQRGTQ